MCFTIEREVLAGFRFYGVCYCNASTHFFFCIADQFPIFKDNRNNKFKKTNKERDDNKKKVVVDREEVRSKKHAQFLDDRNLRFAREVVKKKNIEDEELRTTVKTKLKSIASKKYSKWDDKVIEDEFAIYNHNSEPDDILILNGREISADVPQYDNNEVKAEVLRDVQLIIKESKREVFDTRSKKRDQERHAQRYQKQFNDHYTIIDEEVKTTPEKNISRPLKEKKTRLTKEENIAIRASNARLKAYKKEQKKKRQADRKASMSAFKTESGTDVFMEEKYPDSIYSPFVEDVDEYKAHRDACSLESLDIYDQEENINSFIGSSLANNKDAINLIAEYFQDSLGCIDGAVSIVLPIIVMTTTSEYISFYCATMSLLRESGLMENLLANACVTTIVTGAWKHFCRSKPRLTTESGKIVDSLEKLVDIIDQGVERTQLVLHGRFVKTIRNVIILTHLTQFFPQGVSEEIMSLFDIDSKKEYSIKSQVLLMLKTFSELVKITARLSNGEDIFSVMSEGDPLQRSLNTLRELHSMRDNTYSGLPVMGGIEESEWFLKAKDCVDFINLKKNMFGPLTRERSTIQNLLDDVQAKMKEISIRKSQSQRITPLVFRVIGGPGIGKSKQIDFILSQHSIALGRKYSPRMVYHRNGAQKHWDMYDPMTQPYIHCSEVGNLRPNIVATLGDPILMECLSLADSQPYSTPQAEVKNKGKVPACPQVCIWDSNSKDMNIPTLFRNEGAFRRRFIDIESVVKPEFVKRDSDGRSLNQIDPVKSNMSDTPVFDRWLFTVTTYTALDSANFVPKVELSSVDCYALAQYLRDVTLKHTRQELEIKARMDNPDTYEGYQQAPEMKAESSSMTMLSDFYTHITDKVNAHKDTFYSDVRETFCNTTRMGWNVVTNGSMSIFLGLLEFVLRVNPIWLWVVFFTWFVPFILLGLWIWPWWFSVLIAGILFGLKNTLPKTIIRHLDSYRVSYESSAFYWFSMLRTYYGFHSGYIVPLDIDQSLRQAKYLKMIKIIGGAVVGTYVIKNVYDKFVRKTKILRSEGPSMFVFPSPSNEDINKAEEILDCGKSYERIPNKIVTSWNNQREVVVLNKHTSGPEQLEESISKNVRTVRFMNKSGTAYWTTRCLGLYDNIAIINTHALRNQENFFAEVSKSGIHAPVLEFERIYFTKDDIVNLGTDLTVFRAGSLRFRDIRQHICNGENLETYFQVRFLGWSGYGHLVKEPVEVTDDPTNTKFILERTILYNYPKHGAGLCGTPIILTHKKVSFIGGIHAAGDARSHECRAIVLDKSMLKSIEEKLGNSKLLVPTSEPDVIEMLSRPDSVSMKSESSDDELLTSPPLKSPTRYIPLTGIKYYGKLPGYVMIKNKSNLVPNVFAQEEYSLLSKLYDTYGYIPNVQYGKPMMMPTNINGEYISPYNNMLVSASREDVTLDEARLRKCVDRLLLYTTTILESKGVPFGGVRPINLETALNGVKHDSFIRRISLSKSGGFSYPGTKLNHVISVDDNYCEPNERLKHDVNIILNNYLKNKSSGFIYKALLKDEPRAVHKIAKGLTRVFYGSSFASLIVSRMLLAPLYSLMVEHSDAFCTSIGVDMHRETQKLVDAMKYDKFMAGDYKNFDLKIPIQISLAAGKYFVELARSLGYNAESLGCLRCLMIDNIYPFIEVIGELYQVPGLQPSGMYGTAESNSIKNLLMLMYAWYSHDDLSHLDFFSYCAPNTYGDDLYNGVSDKVVGKFNDFYYQKFCEDNYRVTYTSADKGDFVTPVITMDSLTFLKRKFVWSDELGRTCSPLDMDSIYKTLVWRMPSSNVTAVEQIISMCVSVLYELWFHSTREQFWTMREFFIEVLKKEFDILNNDNSLQKRMPTFDELKFSFMSPLIDVSEEDHHVGSDLDTEDQIDSVIALKTESGKTIGPWDLGMDGPEFDNFSSASYIALQQLRDDLLRERQELLETKEPGSEVENRLYEIDITLTLITKKMIKTSSMKSQSGHDYWDSPLEFKVKTDDEVKAMTPQEREEFVKETYNTALYFLNGECEIEFDSFYPIIDDLNRLNWKSIEIGLEEAKDGVYRAQGILWGWNDLAGHIAFQKAYNRYRLGRQGTRFKTESGVDVEMKDGLMDPNTMDNFETLMDSTASEPVSVSKDGAQYTILRDTDKTLSEFLSRPVQIDAINLPLDTEWSKEYRIWDLWSKTQSVRAKLKNFAFINCDLQVRIAISGTPFHMGKIRASYFPLSDANEIYQRYLALGTPANVTGLKQYGSQQKINTVIDVKHNKPVDLHIPYFSPSPMARLFNNNSTVFASSTSFSMLDQLGVLRLCTQNVISSVSTGAATNVYMYIYAFATNVTLGTPTATLLELTSEAGDEREVGPIEGMMQSAATIAGYFTTVPTIGPLAVASQMAFTGMRGIAAYFGWSKPVPITEPKFVKNEPFRNGAQLVGSETLKRITLDPKQELLLHPYGMQMEDEMSYAYLCKQEGLLATFEWASTNEPINGPVWAFGVAPCVEFPYRTVGTIGFVQPTPLSMVANMHQFWSGTITYRFEIVASAFHRGKFAVVFEPNVAQYALISASIDINKQYTFVGDLQETQDFEICVDMAFHREWIRNLPMTQNVGVRRDAHTTNIPGNAEFLNGFVAFWALTELQSPTGKSVQVNVYVKSNDIHFNMLGDDNAPTRRLMSESGLEVPVTCIELNQRRDRDGKHSLRHFGEEPASVRSVLKRYVTVRGATVSVTSTNQSTIVDVQNIFPMCAYTPTGTNTDFWSWFGYWRYAFAGMRGSTRYRCTNFRSSAAAYSWVKASLSSANVSPSIVVSTNDMEPTRSNGTVLFCPHTNAGVEFEIPYYDSNAFAISFNSNPWVLTNLMNGFVMRVFQVVYGLVPVASATLSRHMDFSIGEDFSFLNFTGAVPYTYVLP